MKYPLTIILCLCSVLMLHGQESDELYAEAAITSRHLIPGEQTNLVIRLRGAQPDSRPTAPVVPNAAVNFVRAVTQLDLNRQLSQVFLYRLTPAKPGKYTIPSVTLSSGGKQLKSPPITFEVHDLSTLIPLPAGAGGDTIFAGFFPAKTTLYQGEQCPVTLKLYVPDKLRLTSWGMPDPIKKNCLAWRFSLPPLHELGQVSINGALYQGGKYNTVLSGISPGIATFGPSNLRIIVRKRIIDPRRGPSISDVPVELTIPARDFKILPFPAGAPADFNGAVGKFQIDALCEKLTINENESTEVILRVGGTGNLENLKAPVLTGSGWKVIDTSKVTRGTERRYVSGMVTFRQILRPLGVQSNIPAYSFSYFNPDDKSFHTLTTPPIPFRVIPSSTSKAGGSHGESTSENAGTDPTKVEDMSGILGFIDKPSIQDSKFNIQHSKFWHLVPASICLLIIGLPLYRKIKAATIPSPDAWRKDEALKKLSSATDTRTFYRRAGRFIDQWLAPNKELDTVLAERDALCFQPEDTEVEAIDPDRKSEIIKLLKRCSKLTLSILLFLTALSPLSSSAEQENSKFNIQNSTLNLARDSWKSEQYQQALDFYRQAYPDPTNTPADILYNIGICHHRLEQPGHAALAWHRALAIDPTHHKARQNLRFVEIEQNALRVEYQPWQDYFTYIHPRVFRFIFYASFWIQLIAILGLIFLRPRGKVSFLIILFLSPFLSMLGGFSMILYPDSDIDVSFEKQAIVLEKSSLYSEAHREEKDPRSIPAASLVEVTATRGPWTHITTPDGEEGWMESKQVGIVRP